MSFGGELYAVYGMAASRSAEGARTEGDVDNSAGGTEARALLPAASTVGIAGDAASGLANPRARSASLSPSVRCLGLDTTSSCGVFV